MGLYLNQTSKHESLPAKGKADVLIADGAVEQTEPHYVHDKSVCVVSNGSFDAAAFAFNEEEFSYFRDDGTNRRKRWLECTPEQIAASLRAEDIANFRQEVKRVYK